MNKKVIIGSIIALVLVVVGVFGYQNQMEKQSSDVDVVNVGAVLPLTGGVAAVGKDILNGLESFETEKKDSRKVIYNIDAYDSKATPQTAATVMQKIISLNNRPEVIFTIVSSVALTIQPITEKEKIIMFVAAGADGIISPETKYTYKLLPSSEQTASIFYDYLESNYKSYDIIFMHQSDTNSISFNNAIRKKFENLNNDKLNSVEYTDQVNSYRNVISKINMENKKMIFCITGRGDYIGHMIKALRASGYHGPILCDVNLHSSARKVAGDAIHSVKYLDYTLPSGETYEKFKEAFMKENGKEPDTFSIIPYEALYVYDKVSEKLGKDAWMYPDKVNGFTCDGFMGPINIKNFEIIFPMEFRNAQE